MMQLIRFIGHQVGVVIGRLDQYGLTCGPQGLKLILEPDAVTVAPDDIGEFLGIAKGARGAGTTIVVGLTVRLLNVKYRATGYTSSGTILVPWSSETPSAAATASRFAVVMPPPGRMVKRSPAYSIKRVR